MYEGCVGCFMINPVIVSGYSCSKHILLLLLDRIAVLILLIWTANIFPQRMVWAIISDLNYAWNIVAFYLRCVSASMWKVLNDELQNNPILEGREESGGNRAKLEVGPANQQFPLRPFVAVIISLYLCQNIILCISYYIPLHMLIRPPPLCLHDHA